MNEKNKYRLTLLIHKKNQTYLGQSSDSVLVGEKWRIIANLEIEVNRLVREGGELVAETELVGAVFGCGKGEAVILLFHLFVKRCAIWIFQTAVHIIVTTSYYLAMQKIKGRIFNYLV